MKTITIVTPCYNEEENIEDIYEQVKAIFLQIHGYTYKHLFIDNSSNDRTVSIIKSLIDRDPNVQLIVNNRNFGHIRSPFYGLLQSTGDAGILIAADLQEPPILIKEFIYHWQNGAEVVVGIKPQSNESKFFFAIRKIYYALVSRIAEVHLIKNFTGFGLYDRKVLSLLRKLYDPLPYFRGLIPELGFEVVEVRYVQPRRKRGFSKNSLYDLYDMAMLGFTSHSKVPLRIAAISGFIIAFFSFMIGIYYLTRKLLFWDSFSIGIAPLVIGFFFFISIQLLFLGILGEYVMQILVQVKNRPLVVEKERINFEGD